MKVASGLRIEGARQNNLKNITLEIPHDRLTVITGVSGSGKSSLAFDTIFAEGHWRYVESLSTYARMFLERLDRPDVDRIEHIRPAVALEQKNPIRTARSTVGTATEISDYLRLLYAKVGRLHCPRCGGPAAAHSAESIVDALLAAHAGARALIAFRLPIPPGTGLPELWASLARRGFARVRVDGEVIDLAAPPGRLTVSEIDVVLDRVVIEERLRNRLTESIETCLARGRRAGRGRHPRWASAGLHRELRCPNCAIDLERPQPLLFSFNHPLGACPECKGFGNLLRYDEARVVPDPTRSLADGAVEPWTHAPAAGTSASCSRPRADTVSTRSALPGLDGRAAARLRRRREASPGIRGFFEELESYRYKLHVRVLLSRYRSQSPCPACGGTRLKPAALAVRVGDRTIADFCNLTIEEAARALRTCPSPSPRRRGSRDPQAAHAKLSFLQRVGLGYLTLARQARTLSGGEAQRINLANQLGSQLVGTLYVLDEPSIGLHARDTGRLVDLCRELAQTGNTVIVVEHDRTFIDAADHIVELGPGSGERGGELVFSGSRADFVKTTRSLTARYLVGRESIAVPPAPAERSPPARPAGAREHNLKGVTMRVPLHTLTAVTGVSGSGKSTLVHQTLYRAVARAFRAEFAAPGAYDALVGLEHLKGVRLIDQEPIGRTPRSNPITYIKAFDEIRKLYAALPRARALGLAVRGLLLQRAGRSLRGVRGRWLPEARDVRVRGCLRHLSGVRGSTLPRGRALREAAGTQHRRRAGHNRGRGHRLLRGATQPGPAPARPAGRRSRLPAPRPARHHALGAARPSG